MPTAPAPAPSSDQALQVAPDFIPLRGGVESDWYDHEYAATLAKKREARTAAEAYLYAGGPRPHPWGNAAVVGVLADGQTRAYFPNQAALDSYQAEQKRVADQTKGTLVALNRGLADAGKPQEA